MRNPYELKDEPEVIPPEGGWKSHTYYLVEVSYSPANLTHLAILGVGFVGTNASPGAPGSYSEIWSNSYDRTYAFHEAHYMKAIRELFTVI